MAACDKTERDEWHLKCPFCGKGIVICYCKSMSMDTRIFDCMTHDAGVCEQFSALIALPKSGRSDFNYSRLRKVIDARDTVIKATRDGLKPFIGTPISKDATDRMADEIRKEIDAEILGEYLKKRTE